VSAELPDLPVSSSSRWILSLAGGGYKGLFTAHFLSLLQAELGRPLYKVFDLVAGTSIGSILALGIALGLDASVLEEFLVSKGKRIFPGYRRLLPMPVMGLLGPLYRQKPLRRALSSAFGDHTLRSLKIATLVPTVSLGNASAKVFRTPHAAGFEGDRDQKVIDVALASAAAPLYFPAYTIGHLQFADGGLIANAPHTIAAIEASAILRWPLSNVRMLAVGTTEVPIGMPIRRSPRHWGIRGWFQGKALLNQAMAAQQDLAQQSARVLLGPRLITVDAFRSTEQDQGVGLDRPGKHATATLRSLAEIAWEDFKKHQAGSLMSLKLQSGEPLKAV